MCFILSTSIGIISLLLSHRGKLILAAAVLLHVSDFGIMFPFIVNTVKTNIETLIEDVSAGNLSILVGIDGRVVPEHVPKLDLGPIWVEPSNVPGP